MQELDTTGTGATVLVVANKQMKYGTMRINSQCFDWERVTVEQLAAEKQEADFKQAVRPTSSVLVSCALLLRALAIRLNGVSVYGFSAVHTPLLQ